MKNVFSCLSLIIPLFSCAIIEKNVTLTFIQHTFINFVFDEDDNCDGYRFKNDELARTNIEYSHGYDLTSDEIHNFNYDSLNYVVPKLVGDGYWSYTSFTTSFDEKSGFSSDFLKPCKLMADMTIHFAIYG